MNFKIGGHYIIIVDTSKTLTYVCTIISEDELFVTFKDIHNQVITLNKTKITSFREAYT